MLQELKEYGVPLVLLSGMYLSFIYPLLRKILKRLDKDLNSSDKIIEVSNDVGKILTHITNSSNQSLTTEQLKTILSMQVKLLSDSIVKYCFITLHDNDINERKEIISQVLRNNLNEYLTESYKNLSKYKYNGIKCDQIFRDIFNMEQLYTFTYTTIYNYKLKFSDIDCYIASHLEDKIKNLYNNI